MIVFVPVEDYSTSAAAAATVDSLSLGYVKAGDSRSVAFRIGARDDDATFLLTPSDSRLSLDTESFDLSEDEISDTVTLTLTLPLEEPSAFHVATLTASTGETLSIEWEAVGANSERQTQYPRRSGLATPISSSPILALGDTLLLLRYDPIAFDPDDDRIIVESGSRNLCDDPGVRFRSPCDPCERLSPLNETWGYLESSEIVKAQFTSEQRTIDVSFTADKTSMTYHVAARLILPAEYELTRLWASFAPETAADKEQFKRSVIVVKRLGELFAVENVRTLDISDDLSHFECDLVALHNRDMGSPDFFNPFSVTYEFESDKPYAAYVCDLEPFLDHVADGSGSNASNYNPSAIAEPETPAPEPETAPVPVAAWYFDANRMLIVEFDKELQTLENGALGNWTVCDGTDIRSTLTVRPNAIGQTVTMTFSAVSTPGCTSDGEVTYSAATPDVIGANGLPVVAFTFSASVI